MPIIPWVGDLIRQTPGVISLGQGVVHYPPPATAHEALLRFLRRAGAAPLPARAGDPGASRAHHGPARGRERDRRGPVLADGDGRWEHGLSYTALLAACDEGDEVVLVKPYFFNHEMAVRIIGCRPVVVASDERYQLDLAAIEAAVGPRTPRRRHRLAQ